MAGPAAASAGLRPSAAPAAAGAAAGRTATPGRTTRTVAVPKSARFAEVCGAVKKKGVARCFAERRTDDTARHLGLQQAAVVGYGPADLVSAYNLPANGGAGQTVAIVDAYDDPNAEADLAVYRAQFGLPACTTANGCFHKVAQDGSTTYPAPNSGWAGETSLDLDMVSAVAPQAHILLVEADSDALNDLGASVNEAVALGAKYVSNSYGASEDLSETSADGQYYSHPGVVVTASSGDSGYGAQYPAASPYVTSVGGTSLTRANDARGWSESAWSGAGSGCSAYEPKPTWQQDTGCSNRTVADVSAVADPATGVATYDTYQSNGWSPVGGTSVASPVIAAVYADAGTPIAGSSPASYPYADASQLNDVTSGSNGTCAPSYLCTGGSGYDGPTGLGTPSGVAAFTTGPHGTVTGTVTDSSTNAAIAGATVTVDGVSAITDASGHYSASVPVGTYAATVSDFGYATKTVSGVTVTDGGSVTEDIALEAVPSSTVSGTVTGGSGHPWPLYATITIEGVPLGSVRTDPHTGRYSVRLPQGASYTLHVDANYPGYQAQTKTVTVGTSDTTADMSLPVDLYGCAAPGYTVHNTGTTQTFDGTSAPTGWTVQQNTTAGGWVFDDPTLYVAGAGALMSNRTGGSGNFAVTDTSKVSYAHPADMSLISPVADLSGAANPVVSFDTGLWMNSFGPSTADVDVTTDGGATWKNVWERTSDVPGPVHVDLPLPMVAHQSAVQVRFHFTNGLDAAWQLDDVFVGNRTCDPDPGGLVVGTVTDANTGKGVVGATVTSVDNPADHTATIASPGDPNVPDGFYWMFSSLTGAHDFAAARRNYVTTTTHVDVAADAVNGTPIALKAGRITVSQPGVNLTVPWQGTAGQVVTVKNTGTAPTTVTLGQHPGGMAPMTAQGAPTMLVKGHFSPRFTMPGKNAPIGKAAGAAPNGPVAGEAWTEIADYGPGWVMDNGAVSLGGRIYSAFGQSGIDFYHGMYVYDPTAGSWSRSVDPADVRDAPAMVALNGKIYATGGWGSSGTPDAKSEVFDPAANAWTTAAVNPDPLAGSGVAVVGGRMYVVGGCEQTCGATDVTVYDPATDSWSRAADYPEPVAWESCGAIFGQLYCAGGEDDGAYGTSSSTRHAYVYDPHANSWSRVADLPIDLWGAGYSTSGGRLLVSGGVTSGSATNQGFSYDPAGDAWTPIPNSNNVVYRGAGACGFYKIGGVQPETGTSAAAEVLPGMADCGDTGHVSWLSSNPTTLTLAPGASAQVTVTGNANVPDVTQPGTYTAALVVAPNTPYPVPDIAVSMTVDPPKTWGKITGTVTGPSGPLPGAQVQISTAAGHWTLRTDAGGRYQLWLDARSPLQLICSDDGYQPQATTLSIKRGATTTLDFALPKA